MSIQSVETETPSQMPPTTFAHIIPVKQLSSHQYSTHIEDHWCIGTVPNGGYITSKFLVVARAHMQMTHASINSPHPINAHLEFLRRTQVGATLMKVRDVKIGSRISNLHITLAQEQDNGEWLDEVEAYVTMTNIAKETGLSLDTAYTFYPARLPVNLERLRKYGQDDNYALRAREPFPQFRRAVLNLQMYLIKPERRPADRPKSLVEQWVRFTPGAQEGGKWTNDALGYVVDIFPQIVEQYINPVAEDATMTARNEEELMKIVSENEMKVKYWYPTLALNLDVKKLLPEEGVDWLFIRILAKAIQNGRLDLNIEVWDEKDQLIATSTHSSLILDSSRNSKRSTKKKDSKL